MSTNLVEHKHKVTKEDRQKLLKQKSPVIWLTGLSGSGKSTVANELANKFVLILFNFLINQKFLQ